MYQEIPELYGDNSNAKEVVAALNARIYDLKNELLRLTETTETEVDSLRSSYRRYVAVTSERVKDLESGNARLESWLAEWKRGYCEIQGRLDRLDELLANETPPEGLAEVINGHRFDDETSDEIQAVWDWFREQLGGRS